MAAFTTAALLGSAAISGGSSILGGLFGRSAAKKAAETQAKAAQAAGDKVGEAVRITNPAIAEAARNAGADVVGQAKNAGAGVVSAAGEAGNYATDAANNAKAVTGDVARKTAAAYNPYAALGEQSADVMKTGLAEGGTFNKAFTANDFMLDPGYQFRLSQGMKLLQQRNGALGAATGGGAAKDYMKFNSDLASQEFGAANDRFEKNIAGRFDREKFGVNTGMDAVGKQSNILNDAAQFGETGLKNAALYSGDKLYDAKKVEGSLNTNAAMYSGDAGMHAADTIAANTVGGARTAADYLTQGANAKAAGIVGGSNALWGGVNNAVGGATGALSLAAYLKMMREGGGTGEISQPWNRPYPTPAQVRP
jgi:hypothetical protein